MEPISGFFSTTEAIRPDGPESLELLSRQPGGRFEIWRGTRHGRFRVWKCLQEAFRGDALSEEMLRKEFEIGYSLRHNHIVEYYDFADVPGLGRCIEMEWIDGAPLSPSSRTEENRRLALQICDALGYLHARQVIHKDLKEANILVTHNGRNVKLIDFGLSDTDDTLLRLRAGTEGYAAPELRTGGNFDARTDIYALGKVLEELGFRRIARRCAALRPEKRPTLGSIQKALGRRVPRFWLILAVVLLAAALLILVISSEAEKSTPAPSVISSEAEKSFPAPKNDSAADREALEELFRQATDLFE